MLSVHKSCVTYQKLVLMMYAPYPQIYHCYPFIKFETRGSVYNYTGGGVGSQGFHLLTYLFYYYYHLSLGLFSLVITGFHCFSVIRLH